MKLSLRWVSGLLSALLFWIPVAEARSLAEVGRDYRVGLRALRGPLSYAKGPLVGTGHVVAHQGQALVLILLLTGVEIVRQQVQLSGVRRESISPEQMLKHSAAAAEHILTSGEIWSALFGAGVSSTALAQPVQLLRRMIHSTSARPILKDLLSNGVATLSVFLGWELGAQLFTEARELLESDADYERSENLLPLLASWMGGGTSPESLRDIELLGKLTSNVVRILVHDSDLRNLWLYNAFRQRIATGEFTTLVASMVTATTVGTALFPGAGTLAGLMFGVAGGAVALFIPVETKDWITRRLHDLRQGFWMSGRDGYGLFEFMNYYETLVRISAEHIRAGQPLPPMLKFRYNPRSMNEIMTVQFERMTKIESRMQASRAMLKEARDHGNAEAEADFQKRLAQLTKDYEELLEATRVIYATDLAHLEKLFQRYDYHRLIQDPDVVARHPLVAQLGTLHRRLSVLESWIARTLIPTIRLQMNLPVEQKSYMTMLQKFYIFGFDEAELLKALTRTAP